MLTEAIFVSLISLIGTAIGSFGGILSSQKMVKYRITQLEEKVNRHNNLIERVTALELRNKVSEHRIEKLEMKAS
jgi:hypothetical protein